jgi:hypothetical protein
MPDIALELIPLLILFTFIPLGVVILSLYVTTIKSSKLLDELLYSKALENIDYSYEKH